ncbi:hypothetical protein Pint_22990 [Pistacia integerrima]|uniref:Uncharacterized protein n=1 Tax=Pistacia integerrima TaxID=434235 RepID=A0ACC0YIV1_9ROSI|nr:hypothetical protein Pint_22990 [Pistacia integerrima]
MSIEQQNIFQSLVLAIPSVKKSVIKKVSWHKPLQGFFKLNSDGAANRCTGEVGGAGVIRGDDGKIRFGYCTSYGRASTSWPRLWLWRIVEEIRAFKELHSIAFSHVYREASCCRLLG